jgi:hypothetical protein
MTTWFGPRDVHQAIITKIILNFCNDDLKIQRIFYDGWKIKKKICNDGLKIQQNFVMVA